MYKLIAILCMIFTLMFCEYRFIMINLRPYYADDGILCIEFIGQCDSYIMEE